jgi:hypothetical protein
MTKEQIDVGSDMNWDTKAYLFDLPSFHDESKNSEHIFPYQQEPQARYQKIYAELMNEFMV